MKKFGVLLLFYFFLLVTFPSITKAATLLSDPFTGTTINSSKWNELDAAGAGGTSGNVQQNGSLTVANSFTSSTWGQTALYSVDTFSSTGLEVQALIAPVSDTLLGYGDYDFQSPGTSAFIIDIQAGGNTLALSWTNGTFDGATSCGSDTGTKTYKIKIISGGFEIYKDGALICTHNTAVTINNKRVFLEASVSAGTFDDVLVTGTAPVNTAPDAPTNLVASAGNTQATLTWSAPASNGGSAITDYAVEYKKTASSTWLLFADGVSTVASTTVTSLTNNNSYDFRVSAINSIGTSTTSSVASTTPQLPTAPGAPTIGTASGGNAQATVTFSAPGSNGGSPITSYVVTSSPGSFTASGASSPITVTGLTNGTPYTFTVKAVNAYGTSTPSSSSNSATPTLIGTIFTDSFAGTTINPSYWNEVDPTGLGGTSGNVQQNGSLTIANSYSGGVWEQTGLYSQDTFASTSLEISAVMTPASGQLIAYGDFAFDNPANKAYLLYLTNPAGSGGTVLPLVWESGTFTSSSCGSVIDGATYKMKIIATGFEVYVNNSLACTVTTATRISNKPVYMQVAGSASTFDDFSVYGTMVAHSAPDAPTIGTATAGNAQASVAFTAPVSNGGSPITGYTVTSSPGGFTSTGVSSPIVVTGLTNGTPYTFIVTATNSIGTSASSSQSNSVTPALPSAPGQVTNLSALGVNKQVLLNWTTPSSGGAPITDYVVEYKTSAGGSWSTFSDGATTTLKAVVTGLANNTSYDFRVSAINSGGNGTASTVATATTKAITTLAFVITGESNSGGIGLNSDATAPEIAQRSSVQIENLTSGNFLFEDLHIGVNNLRDHAGLSGYYDNSHGFELQLANSTEAHAFPDNEQVYLVKTGQGGSQVAEWTVGNGTGYWTKFLQRTAAAKTQLPTNKQWVVWLSLGINDSISSLATSTWKTAMVAHINKIKADLPGAIVILTQF